jgi:hypothetical protein
MKAVPEPAVEVDLVAFAEARRQFPDDGLRPFQGQHVAFNADCTRVVASAAELPDLLAQLGALGAPLSSVVLEWVEPWEASP